MQNKRSMWYIKSNLANCNPSLKKNNLKKVDEHELIVIFEFKLASIFY